LFLYALPFAKNYLQILPPVYQNYNLFKVHKIFAGKFFLSLNCHRLKNGGDIMRKIFLLATLILTLLTATVAAEEYTDKGFEYTSQLFGFKIMCPAEPKVVVNPFADPAKRGELLIFAVTPDGQDVAYGYMIQLDAFDNNAIPDFNKSKKSLIDAYIERLKITNAYEDAVLDNVWKGNKGIFAVTAKEIEIMDDQGEVEGVATATTQNLVTFFRTKSGRCISIQLITVNLNDEATINFRKSVSTYQDSTDLELAGKKSKKK